MRPTPRPTTIGGIHTGHTTLRPHPPGQNRIGSHVNDRNAATSIRSVRPARVVFKNRVGGKGI